MATGMEDLGRYGISDGYGIHKSWIIPTSGICMHRKERIIPPYEGV